MKFYRLHRFEVEDSSHGYEFFTNKRDVDKAWRDWLGDPEDEERACACDGTKVDIIEIEPTKEGILKALRRFASHPDNG